MAVVRAATQTAIGREVAVKCVRPGDPASDTRELVREARVTGALEHPNIVPIHTVGVDEDGNPLIVMKRIDGAVWQPDELTLDENIDVLLDVCRAVHFAHSKAIIHRDLKPDNVMIGSFGEVYVLDWGLSVTTDPALGDRLQLASEVDYVAGTPHYMAPEMAAADGPRIGPRTDVYLLGASLHECLTGELRHDGETVPQILLSAFLSAPVTWPSDVPDELGAICNRATHIDPEQRFDNVDDFRQALLDYREHRGSMHLTTEANRYLSDLRAARAADDFEPTEIRELFGACRFAYQQALVTWPNNAEARDGLDEALGLMAKVELRLNHIGAASALLNEMRSPADELIGELHKARQRRNALDQLKVELSPVPGHRRRVGTALLVSLALAAICFWLSYAFRSGLLKPSLRIHAAVTLVFVVLMEGAAFTGRRDLRRNRMNRRFVSSGRIMGAFMLLLVTGAWIYGLDPIIASIFLLLTMAVAFGVTAVHLQPHGTVNGIYMADDKMRYAATMTCTLGFLAACAWPEHVIEILGASIVISGAGIAAAHRNLASRGHD